MNFLVQTIEVKCPTSLMTVWDINKPREFHSALINPTVPEVCKIVQEDDYNAYSASLPAAIATGKLKHLESGKEITLTPEEVTWLRFVELFAMQFSFDIAVDIN